MLFSTYLWKCLQHDSNSFDYSTIEHNSLSWHNLWAGKNKAKQKTKYANLAPLKKLTNKKTE